MDSHNEQQNNQKTKIWIDADSCPTLVRNYVVKYAAKLNLTVNFVANKPIPCNENLPFNMIICNQEKDAADTYILDNAEKIDLVITRDIVFADKLVSKEITTINDRGTVFTKENIKGLLSERDFDFQLAQIGLVKHYNEGYDKKKYALFANCFDKIIHKLKI
ncbi:MAG: DUF188 domain-containing protein [Treponema sp.]|nr:DUF188 domain-containing protein [Treponema sp.]